MECAEIVKITLLKKYSTYAPGLVIDCDDDVAVRLIRDGIAEAEDALGTVVETASVVPVVETADMTPRRIVKGSKER